MSHRSPKNQKGFSIIETIIIVVVASILGIAGWLVYKHDHKPSYLTNTKSAQTNLSPDLTADWITYTSASGGFSLKYPKTWVTTSGSPNCSSGLLMLGANSSSIGRCGTNNFGQMAIIWQSTKAQCGLDTGDWKINSTKSVTVSGVHGLESNATSVADTTSGPIGTNLVQYCFITGGNMYIAAYVEKLNYPNALSNFNDMVTKTLTFVTPAPTSTTSKPNTNSSINSPTTSASDSTPVVPTPAYATSIQILSISDSDVLAFKLNGTASTNNYYENWTINTGNLTGHISFVATQGSPDSTLTTGFVEGPLAKSSTYSVEICENGGQGICSGPYQVYRAVSQ